MVHKFEDRLGFYKPIFREKRTEKTRISSIMKNLPSRMCKDFFEYFLKDKFSVKTKSSVTHVLKVFSTAKAVSCLMNYRYLDDVEKLCNEIKSNNLSNIASLQSKLPEICNMLFTAAASGDKRELDIVTDFVRYLVVHIRNIHSKDRPVDDVIENGVYDPPRTGIAYSFTKHGKPVREMPAYDDYVDDYEPNSCVKHSYAYSAKSGITYLYLVFCPVHYGFCWGYHILNCEGSKDPFSVLYQYLEKAPEAFIYDAGCIFSEYAHNREPKYFRDTEFFHDNWHGRAHKCPYCFDVRRIESLRSINTEICEQFNAYLMKIRYSARAMSQTHFVFHLSFFIHRWNKRMEQNYRDLIKKASDI